MHPIQGARRPVRGLSMKLRWWAKDLSMVKKYSTSTYAEKLKDPRWQKLRLEVMNRNEFHCEICGSGESTLWLEEKNGTS